MPFNRKYGKKTYVKRKTMNKKYTPKINGINKGWLTSQPFPNIKYCQVAYGGDHNLFTGTAGLFGTEVKYSLNGLFDPDVTGVGHQPLGFDQLMLIYAKYKVHGVTVVITWTDPTNDGLTVGYKLNTPNDAAALGGMALNRAKEVHGVKTRPINDSGSQMFRQKFSIPMSTLCQITPLQFNANIKDFSGNNAANPVIGPTMSLAVINTRDLQNFNVLCNIKLIYHCQFYQRLTLPIS